VSRLPPDLTLRGLSAEDAPAAAEVTGATDRTYLEWMPEGWEPAREEDERAYYAKILADPGNWSIGAFETGGRLVAHAVLGQATDGEDPIGGLGHLRELFVHPERWREGIATALLALAEEEMRRRGYERGRLRAPVGAPAVDFYESRGWSDNGERVHIEQYDLDTIGFSKALDREPA
jgi:GNAT superfamily N-acetyltransferase